ncbi:GHMP kinase [Labilibaculum sp. A4]|uniref:GHMP kinase n=1 Tax=Labilibaculum euxinus TaxID=2686357 RepID=A0A7M4D4P6_9BACT|nr:GYDIA family GHMP kinase [Labilibaculum euxinus]MDQ1772619.1 GYDIA family GHMP kinase [Labilibaculum euxinus]MUP37625.1 GHMP kinase [Labilibaculum euxinus]MVB06830.1 GHMP kinase [Labilibaculum euxinus]MWN78390.1 GHMP kinase [Labilibaculum euxinus]
MKPIYKYYSNAKLLLTGEYLVLHGALALAIPLKYGQVLEVFESEESDLEWLAYEKGKLWLKFSISNQDITNQTVEGETEKDFVCFLLNRAKSLNPSFLNSCNFKIRTEFDFDRNWGLGSSSTLINNVAQWADVNPYNLHSLVSNGSGFDIACANYCKPILFRRDGAHPLIYPVDFPEKFVTQLHFVYLGRKQKSADSVNSFLNERKCTEEELDRITQLSKDILSSKDSKEFDHVIKMHELLVSELLGQECVKEKLFSDFKGSVKSLGAWGGDFVMVRSDLTKKEIQSYFYRAGFTSIFSWNEMILGTN